MPPKAPHNVVQLHPLESQAVELAFVIEDPCGEPAVTLARELIALIAARDEVTVIALIGEVRALQLKFFRGKRCTACGADDCEWMWPSGRKCCPDCSHGHKQVHS